MERSFFMLIRRAHRAGACRAKDDQIAKRYGFAPSDIATPELLRDALLRVAAEALPAATEGVNLRTLERHLELRRYADKANVTDALQYVSLLKEATRDVSDWILPDFDNESRWLAGLFAIICAKRRSVHDFHVPDVRMQAVASAVVELRKLGHSVPIVDGQVVFQQWETTFLAWLDEQVSKEIGGLALAELVIARLSRRFCTEQGYFHIVRSAGVSHRIERLGLPSGYLINLAAKHIDKFPNVRPTETHVRLVLEAAEHYATVHDVAPYSYLDVHYRDQRTMVPFVQEAMVFDTFFQIPQFRLIDAARTLAGILDWVPASQAQDALGASVAEVARLIECVARGVPQTLGPAAFSACGFSEELPREIARRILDKFCHSGTVNGEYLDPLRTDALNAWSRPFFKQNGQYLILDGRVAGNAFLECAVARLSDVDKGASSKIGLALERFLRSEMRRRNIPTSSGIYKSTIGKGECDLVIETKERVIFIELKKKSLTGRARSGNDWSLMQDLRKAFLDPQEQLGHHEIAIRQDGHLALNDGSVVRLEGRGVERVAVTLYDFGAFHTRDVSEQMLDFYAGASISVTGGAEKDVDEFNCICRELGKQFTRLKQLRERDERHTNCWFLGIPQLLVMLEHTTDPESFWRELKRTKHMSLGRLSWFFEYFFMRQCNSAVTDAVAQVASTNSRLITG
jgi:hypothetical protein